MACRSKLVALRNLYFSESLRADDSIHPWVHGGPPESSSMTTAHGSECPLAGGELLRSTVHTATAPAHTPPALRRRRVVASPAAAPHRPSPPAPASEPSSVSRPYAAARAAGWERAPSRPEPSRQPDTGRARRPRPVQPSPGLARRPPSPGGTDSMLAFMPSTCQSRTTGGQPSAAAGLQMEGGGRVSESIAHATPVLEAGSGARAFGSV